MKSLVIFIWLMLLLGQGTASEDKPRRSLSFHEIDGKEFTALGFTNMSSMLMEEDLGKLIVGARGKVYTLNLDNISDQTNETNWIVSNSSKAQCMSKGKGTEDCDNYIKGLHVIECEKFLVCGTYAFQPQCVHMTFENGQLTLSGKELGSKGIVPFDPHQRHVSLMTEHTLFSATYSNFLGTEPVFQRTGPSPLKSEHKRSWFNEPTFVSIQLVETSKNIPDVGDDSIFLFFTERAVEQQTELLVSRIARVCKGDMGGKRTLQRKWTSFLKARLDCPMGQPGMHSLVQDVFLLKDRKGDWRKHIFYAVFTTDPESCSQSAVCAYKFSDISQAFSGNFLSRQRSGRWDSYTGEVPVPRPGSCINNAVRDMGVASSLDLPDRTLQFVKDHPILENVIQPLTGKALLFQKETRFTKIAVERVITMDGAEYEMMYIGTDSGWLQKAVQFSGDNVHVIEELQMFKTPQPVSFLQFSSKTGQLYAGSHDAVVQIDVRECRRFTSCFDCIRARNPYCAWIGTQCLRVHNFSGSKYQSLIEGDTSKCPTSITRVNPKKPVPIYAIVGLSQLLACSPDLNRPVNWIPPENVTVPSDRHRVLDQGLFITQVNMSDAGLYTCQTMETVENGRIYTQTVVQYTVQVYDRHKTARYLRGFLIGFGVCLGLILASACRYAADDFQRNVMSVILGTANTNCNNHHHVRSADQDGNCQKVDELVSTEDSVSSSEGSITSETGSADFVIDMPEDTGVQQPGEVMEQGSNKDYVVIEIPEGS